MPIVFYTVEELAALVQPEELAAAGFKPPVRVALSEGQDHTGTESLYLYLIFPDKTRKLMPDKVIPMGDWASRRIQEADRYDRFVYVRTLREKRVPAWLS